jgi:hypothetical protein
VVVDARKKIPGSIEEEVEEQSSDEEDDNAPQKQVRGEIL